MRGPEWVHAKCTTLKEYLELQRTHIAQNARKLPGRYGKTEPFEAPAVLSARSDHGRWIVDCGYCGNGVSVSPAWRVGCCFSCGAIYRAVVFPDDIVEIVEELKVRKMDNQNWEPGETVATLKRENREHGIKVEADAEMKDQPADGEEK